MKAQKAAIITLLCIIQSCAKESSILPCNISFKGSLEASVKSTQYLASGVLASLYIFNKFENSSTNLTPSVSLISDGFFGLYPTEYVILNSGLYDIFSISFNNKSTPHIPFNTDFKATPENYIDYIWASKYSNYISSSTIIEFTYTHIATKVCIIVNSPDAFSNVTINSIKFTLPNCSSSFIDLLKGEITPANIVLPLTEISGEGNSRTFIAIPCSAQKEIEVSINATIEGTNYTNLIYKSYIETPFTKGNFYTINVNIENIFNSSLSFVCNDWNHHSNYIPY